MKINRRDFLKWISTSALALGLSQMEIFQLEEALAATNSPPVIWLQGSSCTGCSVAALNVVSPTTIDDILLNKVSLKYHPSLMAAGGDMAIQAMDQEAQANAGQFILVIEGGVPTANSGKYCIIGERNGVPITMLDAVNTLGPKAKYVIDVGSCSSYGGIPAVGTNPTGIIPVKTILANKTINPIINIPGCPAPPESVFGTIVKLITGINVSLDTDGRPTEYYGTKVHTICPRRGTSKATALGQSGCLLNLGCMGPGTVETCPNHKWNNGKNWCIGAGHHCIGCASATFASSKLYGFGTYGTTGGGGKK